MLDGPPPNAWIAVIERGDQWTAALKTALPRAGGAGYALRVRRLDWRPRLEWIDESAVVFLCVEIAARGVHESLEYLERARRRPNVKSAALVDRGAVAGADPAARGGELTLAALEAGACLAVTSPRAAERVARVAQRWLALAAEGSIAGLTPPGRAWRRLPWQGEPWPVG